MLAEKIYIYGAEGSCIRRVFTVHICTSIYFFWWGGYIRPQNDSLRFFFVNTGLAFDKCDSLQCHDISPNPVTTTAPNNIITCSYR